MFQHLGYFQFASETVDVSRKTVKPHASANQNSTSTAAAHQPRESHHEAPRQRLHSASESQRPQRPQQPTLNRPRSLHESGQVYSDKENVPPLRGELTSISVVPES